MWRHNTFKTIMILAPLTFAFAFALDIYIPAVPKLHTFFHTSNLKVQLTLSAFMLVNGFGQLIMGPIADQIGRQRLAIFCALLYTLGSILAASAHIIEFLIFSRMIQAAGACGLIVVSFAVVRDLYVGDKSGKMYSYLNGTIAISPMLAPIIGSYLDLSYGWRACFVFLTAIGILVLLLVILPFKETLAKPDRIKISSDVFSRYLTILKNKQFLQFAIISAAGVSCFFTYFSGSSIIYIKMLHTSEIEFSILFAFAAAVSILGSVSGGYLCEKIGINKTTAVGGGFLLISGVSMIVGYYILGMHILNFVASVLFMSVGATIALGASAGGAMEPFKEIAGTAAAMLGFIQFGVAGAVATVVIHFITHTYLPLAITLSVMGAITLYSSLCIKVD